MFQSARQVVPPAGTDLYSALREDGGVRSILESGLGYGPNIVYVAIVDLHGVAIAHSTPANEGQPLPEQEELINVINGGALAQLRAVSTDNTYEIRRPLLADDQQFGSIRVGISTLLIQDEFKADLSRAAGSVVAALFIATFASMFLANWMLRPIHVIQSGLDAARTRRARRLARPAGRRVPRPRQLVRSGERAAVGRPLAAAAVGGDRPRIGDGEPRRRGRALLRRPAKSIFTNAAMKALLVEHRDHPAMKGLIDQTLVGRKSLGPVSIAKDPEHGRVTRTAARDACDR